MQLIRAPSHPSACKFSPSLCGQIQTNMKHIFLPYFHVSHWYLCKQLTIMYVPATIHLHKQLSALMRCMDVYASTLFWILQKYCSRSNFPPWWRPYLLEKKWANSCLTGKLSDALFLLALEKFSKYPTAQWKIANSHENKHASLLYLTSTYFLSSGYRLYIKMQQSHQKPLLFSPTLSRGRSVILLSFLHNYELWIQIFSNSFEIFSQKHSYGCSCRVCPWGQCGWGSEVLFLVKLCLQFCSNTEVYWREYGW